MICGNNGKERIRVIFSDFNGYSSQNLTHVPSRYTRINYHIVSCHLFQSHSLVWNNISISTRFLDTK